MIRVVKRANYLSTDSYRPALALLGIKTTTLDTDSTDKLPPLVRIASMHRVKALELPRMVLAGIQKGTMPYEDVAYASRDEEAKSSYDEVSASCSTSPRHVHAMSWW